MRFLAFLSFVISTTGAPAFAQQQAAPADIKLVGDCLEGLSADFGAKCIGIIADPCIKDAAGKDDAIGSKRRACAARELVVWNKYLTDAIKKVNAGGFKEINIAVAQSQNSWRLSKDKLCPIFDKTDTPPEFAGANYCRLQETARRTLILRRLGDDVNEH